MTLKMTAAFKEAEEGWTETYFLGYDTIPAYVGGVQKQFEDDTAFGAWLTTRREILNRSSKLEHVRVGLVGSPGVFITHDFSPQRGQGRYGNDAESQKATEIFASLLVRWFAGATHRKTLYLGGIPEEIVQAPQTYAPTANWLNALRPFEAVITGGNYVIPSRPVRNPAAESIITTFSVNPDGKTASIVPDLRPPSNPAWWYVIIRGLKNPPGWNGVHRAIHTGGVTAEGTIGPTRKPMRSLPAFVADPSATIVLANFGTSIITSADEVRVVSRRRGRPFGQSRGRR